MWALDGSEWFYTPPRPLPPEKMSPIPICRRYTDLAIHAFVLERILPNTKRDTDYLDREH
jgi:hypothetical protein